VTVGSVIGIAVFLDVHEVYPTFVEALRYSAFNVVSIATTTGFASTDYALVAHVRAVVDAVPVQFRHQRRFHRRRHQDDPGDRALQAGVSRVGARDASERRAPDEDRQQRRAANILFAVLAFGFIYMVCIVSMTLLLSFSGLEIITAFTAVVASINNTGPGLGEVGPATNFAGLTDFQTWVCTIRDASRPSRDFHPAGGPDAGVLAQVAGNGG
jgi:trk system potassium uptake protein TrkH